MNIVTVNPLPSPWATSSQAFSINAFSVTYPRRTAEISLGPRDPKRIGRA